MTYYEILGVAPTASLDEIERAYRRLARQVHPDLNPTATAAADRMKQLNEIRATLTDPLLRSAYDDRLQQERPRPRAEAEAPAGASQARPAAEPIRRVSDLAAGTSGLSGRRRRLPTTVLVLALMGGGLVVLGPRLLAKLGATPADVPYWLLDLLRIERPHRPAPPPVEPRVPSGPRPRERSKVVTRGDTAEEVRHKLGLPDRVEPGGQPGQAFFIYGDVRLELRHGRLVGGGP